MNDSPNYNEPIKNSVRESLINHAIKHLTTSRKSSYLVQEKWIDHVTNHFIDVLIPQLFKQRRFNKEEFTTRFNQTYSKWKDFYKTHYKSKNTKELKVLYLSGPQPQNDLDILLNKGILPQNIWAIEGDKNLYKKGVNNLKENKSLIKLHHGSLDEFFQLYPDVFDIIYFDACSPLLKTKKKENPLFVLKEIFEKKRLTPLGSLITNFAEIGDNKKEWATILGTFYATLEDDNCPTELHNSNFNEVDERYVHLDEFITYIEENTEPYYSDFIRRFIPLLSTDILPVKQLVSFSKLSDKYFIKEQELLKVLHKKNETPDLSNITKENILEKFLRQTPLNFLSPTSYPTMNWVDLLEKNLAENYSLNLFFNEKCNPNSKIKLKHSVALLSLLKNIENANSGWTTFSKEVLNDKLQQVMELDFFDRDLRITCDVPMKNLIAELIVGLYGFPYIENGEKHLSLKYKAKETAMYSDVFIFDQARYMYDFLPTLELVPSFFNNIFNQIIVRCCIDQINRKHRMINGNLFWASLIEDMFSFNKYSSFKNRRDIKK